MSNNLEFEIILLKENSNPFTVINNKSAIDMEFAINESLKHFAGGYCNCGKTTKLKIQAIENSTARVSATNWCCFDFQQRTSKYILMP